MITEDSDILVYMAAAKSNANVLYKMDEFGRCKELGFDAEKISSLPGEILEECSTTSSFFRSLQASRFAFALRLLFGMLVTLPH